MINNLSLPSKESIFSTGSVPYYKQYLKNQHIILEMESLCIDGYIQCGTLMGQTIVGKTSHTQN